MVRFKSFQSFRDSLCLIKLTLYWVSDFRRVCRGQDGDTDGKAGLDVLTVGAVEGDVTKDGEDCEPASRADGWAK